MMHGLARFSAAAFAHTARSLMTRNVQVCASDDGASSVMLKSTQRHIRHMPVVQDSRLVGLVSPGDLVKQRLSKLGNRLGGGGGTSIATAVGGSFSRHLGARSGPRICSAQAGTFATAQERRPKEKGPLVNTARPKSREETPRKGNETSLFRERRYGSAKWLYQGGSWINFSYSVKICTKATGAAVITN